MGRSWLAVVVLGSAACTTFGASPNGNADGGAGAGACAHTLCQDFDHGPPAPPWNVSNLGRTAVIVNDQSFSSPSSLRATIGTDSAIPMVTVALPKNATHVRCGMQVQLAQSSTLHRGRLRALPDRFDGAVERLSRRSLLRRPFVNFKIS